MKAFPARRSSTTSFPDTARFLGIGLFLYVEGVRQVKSSQQTGVDERQECLPLKAAHSDVRVDDIARQPTLSGALALSAAAGGLDLEKEVHIPLGIDAGHWTRMRSGAAGIQWKQLAAICDLTGNDAPILWMLFQRGYDLHSLRKRESETERQLREAREENAALRRVLMGAAA